MLKLSIRNFCLILVFLSASAHIFSDDRAAKTQSIWLLTDSSGYYPGESFVVKVRYVSSDRALVTGLGIRIHFDSTQLELDAISDVLPISSIGVQVLEDQEDYDQQPSTDKYVNASWAELNGNWPREVELPATLLSMELTTTEAFTGSSINITVSSTDVNFVGQAQNLSLLAN